ncbi:polysaccharide biosynthesis tyrosine autokinase [Romboutsia ilealis]|uniref:non-specific protein-tyrosine kinase n=1 Tax=Romboutsia faecis TaxID=2764597 RepID=A0ABR7JLQ8_9FIRM|nr:CpsD/CapB family tyrosine-protein kinase [Romboutsia faecis]MBC5995835.1 CpsD/CapB family tyrosine-protein kinase [Romboutsia faecis]MRN23034.1 polysaccharide biosynthesis tyrosine autokinase [Romboutsia ilealis]
MNLFSYNNPNSNIAEAYRLVRTNIEFSSVDNNLKTILLTSANANEGKSTVISNLATTFANLENKKVLILDCDLRNPSVHELFGLKNIRGISDFLIGKVEIEDCIQKTIINDLDIICGGKIPPNPSEMLQSNKMRNFINEIRELYDYIFIDTPPVGIVTDASILAQYTDGTIILIGSEESNIESIRIAKQRLEDVNANIIGAILNKFKINGRGYGYYNDLDKSKKKKKYSLFRNKIKKLPKKSYNGG